MQPLPDLQKPGPQPSHEPQPPHLGPAPGLPTRPRPHTLHPRQPATATTTTSRPGTRRPPEPDLRQRPRREVRSSKSSRAGSRVGLLVVDVSRARDGVGPRATAGLRISERLAVLAVLSFQMVLLGLALLGLFFLAIGLAGGADGCRAGGRVDGGVAAADEAEGLVERRSRARGGGGVDGLEGVATGAVGRVRGRQAGLRRAGEARAEVSGVDVQRGRRHRRRGSGGHGSRVLGVLLREHELGMADLVVRAAVGAVLRGGAVDHRGRVGYWWGVGSGRLSHRVHVRCGGTLDPGARGELRGVAG